MKKIVLILACASLTIQGMAQTKQRVNAALTAAENSKSGNFKDILNGFYQLAFKTLSKDEKAIEFNSSLFAFIKKHDNDILKTRTRADIRFLRNFQVNTKINLDDEFNFNGYSAGFTYAIVNERDRSFVNLTGTDYDLHNVEFKRLLMGVTNSYLIPGPPGITAADRSILTESLNTISNDIVNDRDSGEALYATVVADLDAAIAASPYFGALPGAPYTTVSARALISGLRATHMNNLENKPLWTISTDGIADKNNKFNRINAETIFLAGNRFGELDFRAKFSYADTLAVSMPRSVINAKLGYNFKVIKGSDNKSVLELKGYGEYNNILKNALPDEKESTFLANAELRVRVTDNLWIPFTIKYDIENANVLGFLNISYNFGD